MTANVNITKVLFKRGNTAQNAAYTGINGEITVDTQAKTLRVHDGVTAGGNAITVSGAIGSYSNTNTAAYLASQSITSANIGAFQTFANANAAAQATSINTVNANIGAYQTYANSNAATQATSIDSINANVGAFQTLANANAATQTTEINSLRANITAANTAINTIQSGVISGASYVQIGSGINQHGAGTVSIGPNSNQSSGQGNFSVAIGQNAATQGQGTNAIAIGGYVAEAGPQGDYSIAMGQYAGQNQGNHAVAIGTRAGGRFQAPYSVAIGAFAGNILSNVQTAQSIILNASSNNLIDNDVSGFFVNPVRNDDSNRGNVVYYNTTTKELSYSIAYSNANIKSYLSTFDGNILPSANVTYSLGSEQFQWRDLWVSNNTIYIGNTPIRVDGGTLLVNGAPVGGGATGDITFTNTTMSPPDGEDIIISAASGQVDIQALDFRVVTTDDVRITGNDVVSLRNLSPTEPISIFTDYNGSAYGWEFNADGTLTAPGDIVVSGDVTGTVGASTLNLLAQPGSNTYIQLNNTVDSYIRAAANLTISTANTDHTWTFDNSGNLIFPDSTTQITAFSNTAVATYLSNFDGTINFTASPAIISGLGNISTARVWTGNLEFVDGSYQTTAFSNAAVVSYFSTAASGLTVAGNITQQSAYYEAYANVTNSGGNLTCNFVNGATFYATLTANVTVNFANVVATAGQVTGATIIVDQGATAYSVANIQINGGSVQTIRWAGGATNTGTASNTDIMSFSLISLDGTNWRILGQIANYA